jgi:hypothetical protein
MSNPFHQYDTRYKSPLPQRMNANVPWQQPAQTYTYTNPAASTVPTGYSAPTTVYFHNNRIVTSQQWWGSFGKQG